MDPLMAFPYTSWVMKFCAFAIMCKNLCVQPLVVTPLAVTVCSALPLKVARISYVRNVVAVVAMALGTLVSVLYAKEMALVLNVVGGVLISNIAFMLPPLAYWKVAKDGHKLRIILTPSSTPLLRPIDMVEDGEGRGGARDLRTNIPT